MAGIGEWIGNKWDAAKEAAKEFARPYIDAYQGNTPAPASGVPGVAPAPSPSASTNTPAPAQAPAPQDTGSAPSPAVAPPPTEPTGLLGILSRAGKAMRGQGSWSDVFGLGGGSSDGKGGSMLGNLARNAMDFMKDLFSGDNLIFKVAAAIVGAALAFFTGGGALAVIGALAAPFIVPKVASYVTSKFSGSGQQTAPATVPAPAAGVAPQPQTAPSLKQYEAQLGSQLAAVRKTGTEAYQQAAPELKAAAVQSVAYLKDTHHLDEKTALALTATLYANNEQWKKTHMPELGKALMEKNLGQASLEKQMPVILDTLVADLKKPENASAFASIQKAGTRDDAIAAATSLYFKPADSAKVALGTAAMADEINAQYAAAAQLRGAGISPATDVQAAPPIPSRDMPSVPSGGGNGRLAVAP